jgi:tryptophanyl-tRNA synthetase
MLGLFFYPVLMAADILLFDTNFVPVGQDQRQHVEMARSIAQRINNFYKKSLLVEPQEVVEKEVATVVGLDGRKMSKSYDNSIPLFVDDKSLRKYINKIKTDSTGPTDPKDPDTSAIFQIYCSI